MHIQIMYNMQIYSFIYLPYKFTFWEFGISFEKEYNSFKATWNQAPTTFMCDYVWALNENNPI